MHRCRPPVPPRPTRSSRRAHVVYALHTLGLVIGAFGTASVIGAFLFGWPSIIAVIINYVKRSEVRGTWLESHFSWQIRTFWWALLWALVIAVVGTVFAIVLVGFAIWIIGFFALGLWAIYRIARGWLRLKDRQPMPVVGTWAPSPLPLPGMAIALTHRMIESRMGAVLLSRPLKRPD